MISEFILGDMYVCYDKNAEDICTLKTIPLSCKEKLHGVTKEAADENLIQLKIAGDKYNEAYAGGLSLRNSETTRRMKYVSQEVLSDCDTSDVWHKDDTCAGKVTRIKTKLADDRGLLAEHVLTYREGDRFFTIHNSFYNNSENAVSLELFESFSLSGLTPFIDGDAHDSMDIHRFRTAWSAEGRHTVDSVEDIGLERSWALHAVRCERYGQVGSMPVNHFFPFGAVHDRVTGVYWGAMLAHNASWQMEFYRKDDGLSFGGGLGDREFAQWMKTIEPGGSFTAPTAILSCACGRTDADFDIFCQRLTSSMLIPTESVPESEKGLPVIFNEYCTTWGNPTHENIDKILSAIKGKGISYFVIDCGWYKQPGIPWDRGMGDYEVSNELFPEGLEKTIDLIRSNGYVPGIWFEAENVAQYADAYKETDHLLHRDGEVLTTYARRFYDMRDPWVRDRLNERVIGTLKKYGFGYVKIDYNESIGIGCDGAESLGEGLRQNMEATVDFFREMKSQIPDLIIENCASGGHRLEPLMMSLSSMASFSDVHECEEIPIIAANLHRLIHPVQSQIWAVIRETDSLQRIIYSLSATLLGRMCLSGDVTGLNDGQWKAIESGIAFYKQASHVIRDGVSVITRTIGRSYRHPDGYQVVYRYTDDNALAVVHRFAAKECEPDEMTIRIPLELGHDKIESIYALDDRSVVIEKSSLCVKLKEFDAACILLKA